MSEELNPYETPKVSPVTVEKQTKSGLTREYHLMNTKVFSILSRIALLIVVVTGLAMLVWYLKMAGEYAATGELVGLDGDDYDMMLKVEEVYGVTFWGTLVLVAFWKYRSMNNAWALMKTKVQPTVSPGWAVGWYVIPIANLWKPFTAMSEIVKNTFSTTGRHQVLLRCWWGFWLLGSITARISDRAVTPDDIVAYLNTQALAVGGMVLAGGCLERIIAIITARQMKEYDSRKLVNNNEAYRSDVTYKP